MDTATFTKNQAGAFTVSTTGFPLAILSISPADQAALAAVGLAFVDNHDGTATVTGTPTTFGSTVITVHATTTGAGFSASTSQLLTIQVDQAPTITSLSTTTFTVGQVGTFTVNATPGTPIGTTLRITSVSGAISALPVGVTFVDNGSGVGLLSGTPAPGSGGIYAFTIIASNPDGLATAQTFILNIDQPPAFISGTSATFETGKLESFVITTSGFSTTPTTITQSGNLPAGVGFVDNGNGTATLSGIPTVTGAFPLTFTVSNASFMGNTTAGSTTVSNVSSVAGLAVGEVVTGTGIPAGATIKTIGPPPSPSAWRRRKRR